MDEILLPVFPETEVYDYPGHKLDDSGDDPADRIGKIKGLYRVACLEDGRQPEHPEDTDPQQGYGHRDQRRTHAS